jgi:cell division protein ZapE
MLVQALEARVENGDLLYDPQQWAAAERLQRLAEELEDYDPAFGGGGSRSWLHRLVGRPTKAAAPHGVYLHGAVGRGKSMLMDLFFISAPLQRKRRVHFHEFMLEVHRKLAALRQNGGDDPIRGLAQEIAGETDLLCFDEFHVVNIADAMILGRLFEGLFERGVVVVATSNWPPYRLYEGGLNRDRFVPFIELLMDKVDTVTLDGPIDYRTRKLPDLPIYLSPLGPAADRRLGEILAVLGEGETFAPASITVGTRTLAIPQAANGIAVFEFRDLCARALGAADYLALTEQFHTLVLKNVPRLSYDKRNEARRFMTLVDALYERKAILIVTADAPPAGLYPEGEGLFEFQRTVSRLTEMQSSAYLMACRDRRPDQLPKDFIPFALTSDIV